MTRRDCRSHHSGWLVPLAQLSLVLGVLSLVTVLPGLVGLPVAVAVYLAMRHDLAEIEAGRTDPAGREPLREGVPEAAWGAALSACGLLIGSCLGLLCLTAMILTYNIS